MFIEIMQVAKSVDSYSSEILHFLVMYHMCISPNRVYEAGFYFTNTPPHAQPDKNPKA